MKLDLGCGSHPTGDVNVDYYVKDIGHRTGNPHILGDDIPINIGSFVRWNLNVLPLPFGTGSFDEVFCSHTIEHLNDPFRFLEEMVRITKFKVTVVCPHRLGERATLRKNPFHVNYFGVGWFHRSAKKLGCYSVVRITNYAYLPNGFFPLVRLPLEITAELTKREGNM